MKQGLIYARVSTEEQAKEGQSIEAQIKLCKAYAQENDIRVSNADVYIDEGKSGSNTNRPGLQAFLERVVTDKSIEICLVLDTDRLARNTLDHLSIKNILKKQSVSLISVSQPLIDSSPEGNFIDTVLAATNALQSQITGRKTAKTLDQKAKSGWWPGAAPVGYINVENDSPTSTSDKKIIDLDPNRSELLKRMFQLYSTGSYNLLKLSEKMYSLGLTNKRGTKIGPGGIHRILRSSFYIGKIKWANNVLDGNHPSLIDDDTWQTCQVVLANHNQNGSRTRKYNYLLRGFVYCADCGSRYWAGKHTGHTTIKDYYFCKHCKRGTYTDVSDLERQVITWIAKIEITDEFAQELKSEAEKVLNELREQNSREEKSLQNQRSSLKAKIRGLEDKYLNGEIDSDRFNSMLDRLESQVASMDAELTDSTKNMSTNFENVMNLINMARNLKKTYKDAMPGLKRAYLELFFDKIIVKDKKIVEVLPSLALKPLLNNGRVRVRVRSNWGG